MERAGTQANAKDGAATFLTPSGRLESIDFLRGCAAMSVLLLHLAMSGGIPHAPLWFRLVYGTMLQGSWGVSLFFVISGFCIHLRWAREYARTKVDRLDFYAFWKRRLHRLYPPYFITLCLSMLMVYIAYRTGRELPLVARYPPPQARWMLYDFFLHVTMLHGFSPSFDTMGGDNVLWSLAREEYFYLMYFVLMSWRRRWNVWISTSIVLVLGVATNLSFAGNPHWSEFVARSAIVLWFQWCLGMVSVEAYYGLIKLPRWCSSGLVAIPWCLATLLSRYYLIVAAPFLGGMAFFILVNFCVKLDCAHRWPKNIIVSWLGRVGIFSYSLYLVHNPIRAVLKQLLRPYYSYTQNPILFILVCAVMGLGCYWGAKLFFWAVERHFLNSSRRGTPSKPAQRHPERVVSEVPAT